MTSPLKAAVIGCGRMGALTTEKTRNSIPPIWLPLSHTDAITKIDSLELVAVCDASKEQVDKVMAHYPGVMGYTDHKQLLAEVKPDIVGIATRTAGRCELIRDCAEANVRGIHAEKPLARSLKENKIAIDALRTHETGFTFGAVRRYMVPYHLAKQIAHSGEIGAIRQIVIEHGSDMLLWGHPHTIDLATFICDGAEIERVQGRLRINKEDVKENIVDADPVLDMAYMEFDNGITVVVTAGHGFYLRIYGETGSVTVVGDGTRVELRKKDNGRPYELTHEEIPFDASISGTQQAFINLKQYVEQGTSTGLELSEVEQVHKVLFALVLSELSGGKAISPKEVPEDFIVTGRFGEFFA